MTTFDVLAVNVAQPSVLLEWPSGDVVSAIDKHPVSTDTLMLNELNLEGDRQADTRPTPAGGQVHGGVDQAVYAFPSEHFGRISEIVGAPVGPGFMGENLTMSGVLEDEACIGDVWEWGSARLQITSPRGPCYKLGIRIGRQAARTVIRTEGLVGWYLRVLVPGEVPVGGPIRLVHRQPALVTVGAIHRALQDRHDTYADLAAIDGLSVNDRAALLRRDRDVTGGVPEDDG